MEKYEKKLQEFRIQEKRKHRINQFKHIFWKPMEIFLSLKYTEKTREPEYVLKMESIESKQQFNNEEASVEKNFNWKKCILYMISWCLLFCYAIYVQFGAVFVILSGFYIIWANTQTSPRKSNELSAYSVFNPNCERIKGTFDAEQIDKQIRSGMMF